MFFSLILTDQREILEHCEDNRRRRATSQGSSITSPTSLRESLASALLGARGDFSNFYCSTDTPRKAFAKIPWKNSRSFNGKLITAVPRSNLVRYDLRKFMSLLYPLGCQASPFPKPAARGKEMKDVEKLFRSKFEPLVSLGAVCFGSRVFG